MATDSFTKEFAITKIETVQKLEESMLSSKPINIDSRKVICDMKRYEEQLLDMLRSEL